MEHVQSAPLAKAQQQKQPGPVEGLAVFVEYKSVNRYASHIFRRGVMSSNRKTWMSLESPVSYTLICTSAQQCYVSSHSQDLTFLI